MIKQGRKSSKRKFAFKQKYSHKNIKREPTERKIERKKEIMSNFPLNLYN